MKTNFEKQTTEKSIQDYLSLGYIYLLALGIIREVVYYAFLDINILRYSNVLDVILSPMIYLAKDPLIFLAIVVLGLLIYYLGKYNYKKKLKKIEEDQEGNTTSQPDFIKGTLFLLALGIFSFFIGTGLGGGFKSGERLKDGDFKNSHQLTFVSNESIQVKLIGNNSQYVFYVLENENQVSVSPISGNVKTIVKLPSKK